MCSDGTNLLPTLGRPVAASGHAHDGGLTSGRHGPLPECVDSAMAKAPTTAATVRYLPTMPIFTLFEGLPSSTLLTSTSPFFFDIVTGIRSSAEYIESASTPLIRRENVFR